MKQEKSNESIKETRRSNIFNIILSILFFLIGFTLMVKGLISFENVFNPYFIFGTLWLLYTIIYRTIFQIMSRIKKLEDKQ